METRILVQVQSELESAKLQYMVNSVPLGVAHLIPEAQGQELQNWRSSQNLIIYKMFHMMVLGL